LGSGNLSIPLTETASSSVVSTLSSWAQSVFPAVASLSAKIQGTTTSSAGAKSASSVGGGGGGGGGGGKNDVDDGATEAGDGNLDDAGSVQSGVSAMLPTSGDKSAGQIVAVAAAAWLSEALCLCIHTAGLTPLKGGGGGGGGANNNAASAALPSWASSASPTDILCISLSLDAIYYHYV
jgi:hypothetical protein